MTSVKYREAYEHLGEERVQAIPDNKRTDASAEPAAGGFFTSETELYWSVRRDYNWSKLPGIFKWVRRTGKREFFETITASLIHLEPATSFNPADAWLAELSRRKEVTEEQVVKKKKKVDELREKNTAEQYARRLYNEVVQIRNSKSNLLEIVHQIKLPQARAILLVQILAAALKTFEKSKDKRLLYETYWALEGMDLPTERAPKVADDRVILARVKDSSLVYDTPAAVEELIAKARKVISRDSDLIRVQLVDMSDSLPPLSKFSFGFKLDVWQIRVLTWIDAGKSVVISAPTSSGKTVLSSYVAVIFKNKLKGAEPAAKGPAASAVAEEDEEEEVDDYITRAAGDGEGEEEVSLIQEPKDFTADLVAADISRRGDFLRAKKTLLDDSGMRVLFVVPTEPLVWQVAAYFTKLLREQGDRKTPVAIVTDQLTYNPQLKLNAMPQIVVGTPFALESALTKSRGLTGQFETKNKAAGDIIPGGFDHFDWVIYDEVHALDGAEGAALQRIIRAMSCKFLALSATIGNAQALRAWMEQVKSEQLGADVECITVTIPDQAPASAAEAKKSEEAAAPAASSIPEGVQDKRVTVVKTSTAEQAELQISRSMTVGALREAICALWPDLNAEDSSAEHVKAPVQTFFQGNDLLDASRTLTDCGMFADGAANVIYVPGRVHCLVHSTRFINLQRYSWDQAAGRLTTVGPLAALSSLAELQGGILQNSSLSFTSSDSYRVYEEAIKVLPAEACDIISPYNFFGKSERITLQRVKDYEDLLKVQLQTLAVQYPAPVQKLLDAFAVADASKEVDLCELILQLKVADMLPCLPFHLNTFEAIRLFQQVLAGLEYRQKVALPTYYMEQVQAKEKLRALRQTQIKSTGGNSKDAEELEKSGELESAEGLYVDTLAPHPDYLLCKGNPLSDKELEDLVHEMELYDGFEKRDNLTGANRGKNQAILQHALVRGLRRGVGLFIEEVSFPSYRRAVQRLASQGKLGVVISDSSLAFGVNMPFRTTVFCGEMRGALDELMAQQMSGRAGRRGLDTQGNIVYAGLRAKVMRRLMIGTVAHIQGVPSRTVQYDSLFLQAVLSPRHSGYHRVRTIGGITLRDFIQGLPQGDGAMASSKRAMLDLGFVSATSARDYRPNNNKAVTYSLLAIVWEMRSVVHESITIGMLFRRLIAEFHVHVRDLALSERKNTVEAMDQHVFGFFSILVQLVARTPYEVPADGERSESVPITELPFFALPAHLELYRKWEALFAHQQAAIPAHLSHLRDPVGPGEVLDGALFQCILDRGHIHTLSDRKKQTLKQAMWHMGNVLKVLTNCAHTEDSYVRVAAFIFRNAFNKLRYLNAELIRGIVQFDSVCDADKEKRIEKEQGCLAAQPKEAALWTDLDTTPWPTALRRTLAGAPAEQFAALGAGDVALAQVIKTFNPADRSPAQRLVVLRALQGCSFVPAVSASAPLRLIALLVWFCSTLQPTQSAWFAAYLSAGHDEEDDLLPEDAVRAWVASSLTDLLPALPSDPSDSADKLTEDKLAKLKKNCEPFLKWLDEQEEEDEEEEEEA